MAGKSVVKIFSWNVNGIRAVYKKGFIDFIKKYSPDILCVQETKAQMEQFPQEILEIKDYDKYFSSAEKKGYSGVCVLTKISVLNSKQSFGDKNFDNEGRILRMDFDKFTLFNIYFPNGKASKERLEYKLNFYKSFLKHLKEIEKEKKNIIICGDVNTAHKEIDLARPKENENISGFLPIERKWIDELVESGFIDVFRIFEKGAGHYTWWDYKTRARERNVGWRIDYFFASKNIVSKIKDAFILKQIEGSDHCPIGIELEI